MNTIHFHDGTSLSATDAELRCMGTNASPEYVAAKQPQWVYVTPPPSAPLPVVTGDVFTGYPPRFYFALRPPQLEAPPLVWWTPECLGGI